MAKRKKYKRRLDLSLGAEDPAERLFAEVAGILEHARRQTVRSVNTYMVTAYWLIGWRIVEAEQGGEIRAGYGERLIEGLSVRLTKRFGRGFSMPNLRNFRGFYLAFQERLSEIRYTLCSEFEAEVPGAAFTVRSGLIAGESTKPIETGKKERTRGPVHDETSFRPNLGWSHYRALMRVENPVARRFYEDEAGNADWSVRDLGQMQLYVNYYDREVKGPDDNPTLGLILCTDKNEAVVRYVLGEGQEQIFASRYRMVLPTEEELAAEVRREMAALGFEDPSVAAAAACGRRKATRPRAKSRRNKRR